jgi:hypothetical protein
MDRTGPRSDSLESRLRSKTPTTTAVDGFATYAARQRSNLGFHACPSKIQCFSAHSDSHEVARVPMHDVGGREPWPKCTAETDGSMWFCGHERREVMHHAYRRFPSATAKEYSHHIPKPRLTHRLPRCSQAYRVHGGQLSSPRSWPLTPCLRESRSP